MQPNVRAVNLDPSRWAGRRVLVTGHTGFKGAWLCLWLLRLGAQVSGLAPGSPASPSMYGATGLDEEVSSRRGDIRDHVAVREAIAAERPDVVIHLAAQPLVRRSLREPRDTFEINVMGTVNVLDAVRQSDHVAAVVVVTSDKCYANPHAGSQRRTFVEDDPLGGSDPYSSSKGCAELVSASFRESFFSSADSAPRLATARAGNVIGGGDWGEDRLVPEAIHAAAAGETIRVRNPHAVRPWQHVLNPLSGYLLLAQELLDGVAVDEAWNFGPDPSDVRPVQWIVERLAELMPALRWELDAGDNPPEADYVSLDSAKAHARLGWAPAWHLDQALARAVQWHDAHRRGEDMRAVSLDQIDQFARAGAAGAAA